MQNIFELRPEERISAWRQFRQNIQYLERDNMLHEVAKLWAKAPIVNYYLEPDHTDQWPDPWMLITENMYCDIAISLGAFYTLFLTERFDKRDLEVVIYKDTKGFKSAVQVAEKYAININPQKPVNTSTLFKELEVYKKFTVDDLNADRYL